METEFWPTAQMDAGKGLRDVESCLHDTETPHP